MNASSLVCEQTLSMSHLPIVRWNRACRISAIRKSTAGALSVLREKHTCAFLECRIITLHWLQPHLHQFHAQCNSDISIWP